MEGLQRWWVFEQDWWLCVFAEEKFEGRQVHVITLEDNWKMDCQLTVSWTLSVLNLLYSTILPLSRPSSRLTSVPWMKQVYSYENFMITLKWGLSIPNSMTSQTFWENINFWISSRTQGGTQTCSHWCYCSSHLGTIWTKSYSDWQWLTWV